MSATESTAIARDGLAALVGRELEGLEIYAPEPVEAAARRLGLPLGQIIKLDANENPYGPTRAALDALLAYSDYHLYPDALSARLRAAVSRYVNLPEERILVGNGSDELIDQIMRLFRPGPGGPGVAGVIDCPPTFGQYAFYAQANDLEIARVPRDDAFRLDIPAIEALCARDPRPRLLFAASPNNPDGGTLEPDHLARLLALPLVVVLDEAYIEFAPERSLTHWVVEHENLIVLRTFSKWAGLAGLRVGYGLFPAALMPALLRLKSPYNANCAAQVAALATLENIEEARERVERIVAERERLRRRLAELSIAEVGPSRANYLLVRLRGVKADTVRRAMERRGVLLRYYADERLADCLRVSVGTPMQNESLLLVLRELARQEVSHG